MRVEWARDVRRVPSVWEGYSLLMIGGAALYFPFWLGGVVDVPLTTPLRVFGFVCPLCGGSRAVGSLVLGDFWLALRYNPLALVILLALLWGVFSYLFIVLPTRRRLVLRASRIQLRLLWALIAALFVANWVYVLASGMHRVPLAN